MERDSMEKRESRGMRYRERGQKEGDTDERGRSNGFHVSIVSYLAGCLGL